MDGWICTRHWPCIHYAMLCCVTQHAERCASVKKKSMYIAAADGVREVRKRARVRAQGEQEKRRGRKRTTLSVERIVYTTHFPHACNWTLQLLELLSSNIFPTQQQKIKNKLQPNTRVKRVCGVCAVGFYMWAVNSDRSVFGIAYDFWMEII